MSKKKRNTLMSLSSSFPLLCSQANELESFVSFPFQKQTDTSVLKSLTVKNVQRILANVINPAAFRTVAGQQAGNQLNRVPFKVPKLNSLIMADKGIL